MLFSFLAIAVFVFVVSAAVALNVRGRFAPWVIPVGTALFYCAGYIEQILTQERGMTTAGVS